MSRSSCVEGRASRFVAGAFVLAFFVGLARLLSACGAPPEVASGSARRCTKDLDCSAQQYCTDARICRTDCFVDEDCIRATSTGDQCNAHGRCVGTPTTGVDPETDAGPVDAKAPGVDVGPPVSDADDGGAA